MSDSADRRKSQADPDSVGARIREVRRRRDLSLKDLAEQADVHYSTLVSWENGQKGRQPSAPHLYRIATALGVRMEDLLGVPRIIGAQERVGGYSRRPDRGKQVGRRVRAASELRAENLDGDVLAPQLTPVP